MALRSHLIVSVRATRNQPLSAYPSVPRARCYNLLTRRPPPSLSLSVRRRVSSAPLTGTLNAGRPSICVILRFARTLPNSRRHPLRHPLAPLRLTLVAVHRDPCSRLGYLSGATPPLPPHPPLPRLPPLRPTCRCTSRVCVIN
jgi:hypothetical protein